MRVLRASLCAAGLLLASQSTLLAGQLDAAAERYRPFMIESIGQSLAGARDLRDRVMAQDLDGAKKAWISARAGWERSEVFTGGFVPELDAKIDAWPNADRGFHAIEAKLFGPGNIDVRSDTDALVHDLDDLHVRLKSMSLTPQGLLDGITQLVYEVGESKADGGESRISGTSLADMQNNVEGIELAYRVIFAESLRAADGKLAQAMEDSIRRLKTIVAVEGLQSVNIPALRRTSEGLAVGLQAAAIPLGLRRPVLEATVR